MFSCLQILEAFLWFVLITLLNVTLIILTLSVSRLLNLLLRLVAFRSEERFSRNAETDLVCRLLLEKKKKQQKNHTRYHNSLMYLLSAANPRSIHHAIHHVIRR